MTEITRYVKGQDPDRDAWLTNFFTENHLAYETFPDAVASPEQLKFIVHLDEGEIYYPCSDELFAAIIEKRADTPERWSTAPESRSSRVNRARTSTSVAGTAGSATSSPA